MRNLVIDIGNTNAKFGVFNGDELLEVKNNIKPDEVEFAVWIKQQNIKNAIISNVGNGGYNWKEILLKHINLIEFNTSVYAGITSEYETQHTLGQDRWAKMIAVSSLNRMGNSLVVDAGTCITIDFLEKGNIYKGGSIAPGVQMRFNALHKFTENLPQINWDRETNIPLGLNTVDALKAGVLGGVNYEVEGQINNYIKDYKDLKIFLTGGNSSLLWSRLKNSIFAPQYILDPYLVLRGLNEVIKLETCN